MEAWSFAFLHTKQRKKILHHAKFCSELWEITLKCMILSQEGTFIFIKYTISAIPACGSLNLPHNKQNEKLSRLFSSSASVHAKNTTSHPFDKHCCDSNKPRSPLEIWLPFSMGAGLEEWVEWLLAFLSWSCRDGEVGAEPLSSLPGRLIFELNPARSKETEKERIKTLPRSAQR